MDTKELFELMEKFDESGLSELKYRTADDTIVLKKVLAPAKGTMLPVEQQLLQSEADNTRTAQASPPVSTAGGEIITAPIVGTFYRSPSPDSPPFAEEGGNVKGGDALCIIEAMKVMNELEADYDMEIISILVENGTMVEYGSPLFEVKRI